MCGWMETGNSSSPSRHRPTHATRGCRARKGHCTPGGLAVRHQYQRCRHQAIPLGTQSRRISWKLAVQPRQVGVQPAEQPLRGGNLVACPRFCCSAVLADTTGVLLLAGQSSFRRLQRRVRLLVQGGRGLGVLHNAASTHPAVTMMRPVDHSCTVAALPRLASPSHVLAGMGVAATRQALPLRQRRGVQRRSRTPACGTGFPCARRTAHGVRGGGIGRHDPAGSRRARRLGGYPPPPHACYLSGTCPQRQGASSASRPAWHPAPCDAAPHLSLEGQDARAVVGNWRQHDVASPRLTTPHAEAGRDWQQGVAPPPPHQRYRESTAPAWTRYPHRPGISPPGASPTPCRPQGGAGVRAGGKFGQGVTLGTRNRRPAPSPPPQHPLRKAGMATLRPRGQPAGPPSPAGRLASHRPPGLPTYEQEKGRGWQGKGRGGGRRTGTAGDRGGEAPPKNQGQRKVCHVAPVGTGLCLCGTPLTPRPAPLPPGLSPAPSLPLTNKVT